MHRYRRAYIDANSPLTPLTPLATDAFNFNIETGPSCSTLAVANRGHNSAGRPRSAFESTQELWGNTPGRICAAAPKSCDSVLQQFNNVTKLVATFGSENFPTPMPPGRRTRRAIKQESAVPMNENVPTIRLQPPPRTKRRNSSIACASTKIKREETFPTMGHTLGSGRQLNSTTTSNASSCSKSSSTCSKSSSRSSESSSSSSSSYSSSLSPSTSSSSSSFVSTKREGLYDDYDEQHLLPPRHFDRSNIRRSSPVEPKPLSSRFGEFLTRWGINCLKSIFERQEIDLQTFCCLTPDDLEVLGIQDPMTRQRAIAAINFIGAVGMNLGNGGCARSGSCGRCEGCDD